MLLNSDFQPEVANFGFAKFIPNGATHVPYRPCIQFCKKTRKQLERILDNLKEKLDVATLLMALHRTLEFEDELTEEFGGSFYLVFTGRKDSIQIYNNEAVANVFPELTSILSSFKDPFYQNVVRRRGILFSD